MLLFAATNVIADIQDQQTIRLQCAPHLSQSQHVKYFVVWTPLNATCIPRVQLSS
jgi:hypothetical protein